MITNCDSQVPDPAPGPYYVSALKGTSYFVMSGPYTRHGDALANVNTARDIATAHDPRAWWLSWGTVRIEGSTLIGKLQDAGLMPPTTC